MLAEILWSINCIKSWIGRYFQQHFSFQLIVLSLVYYPYYPCDHNLEGQYFIYTCTLEALPFMKSPPRCSRLSKGNNSLKSLGKLLALYTKWYFFIFTACDCNPLGSSSQQCDRRTGQCPCLPGMAGLKCDRCARGTTGELPRCQPCGECFDNWDRIIKELRSKF